MLSVIIQKLFVTNFVMLRLSSTSVFCQLFEPNCIYYYSIKYDFIIYAGFNGLVVIDTYVRLCDTSKQQLCNNTFDNTGTGIQ